MALEPTSRAHAAQIAAGIEGRNYGHRFESALSETINSIEEISMIDASGVSGEVVFGLPAERLLQVIFASENINPNHVSSVRAYWLGGLATGAGSGGTNLLDLETGLPISGSSKSDVVVDIILISGETVRRGVSVKSCSTPKPTNDQLFFTQAVAFSGHLRRIGLDVSSEMENDLRRFCGDDGFRPTDVLSGSELERREGWSNRFFWEELDSRGQWENLFNTHQERITRFLLAEGAYVNDPISPTYVLHQVRGYEDYSDVELYISTVNGLVNSSLQNSSFDTRPYTTKGASHLAPRFGFIQFQRGGQKQHPTQLQFNLQAGYFFK